MKLLIIVPTYNESENIGKLIGRLLNMPENIEVLVVDDNSPDGTGDLVADWTKTRPRLHLLSREKKMGLGPAYLAGFRWALQRNYDAVLEMDADLSHRPRYIPRFLDLLNSYDVVAGSRWMRGGRIANWPVSRVLLSRIANLYASMILGVSLKDLTGGFTCYRRAVLETLDLDRIHSDGYSFQIEMKYRSLQAGFRVGEFPITFTDRKFGDSKISRRIVWEALLIVWALRLGH